MTEQNPVPSDRFCDLVMKGGITSGVVYPKAVASLSKHYRFHSIGGTSAGAIAAAVTAAAEYRRRTGQGDPAGFELLATLPEHLAQPVAQTGAGKLLSLFQPAPGTSRLFGILTSALNSRDGLSRTGWALAGLLRGYWPALVVALIIGALAYFAGTGVISALLWFFCGALALIAGWLVFDVRSGFVANGFGLCTGMPANGQTEALTTWLHRLIQTAAGREDHDTPLTFGQLRTAPGSPSQLHGRAGSAREHRSINLKIYATNLSHGRPYVFPLEEQTPRSGGFERHDRLYFDPQELRRYFPDKILNWMKAHGQQDPDDDRMYLLPDSDDLPVLVAARLSLSFPLLMSAVPLYSVNRKPELSGRRFDRCWFSDGGISSNFPMHLFDGLVPRWPTFGINLEPEIEGEPLVSLPTQYEQGYGERYQATPSEQRPLAQLVWFFRSMISSMQNWSDTTLTRMPGVRDRVARVRLKPGEGGMNLNMTAELIGELAARGELAACHLLRQFAQPPAPDQQAPGWDDHRFIRLCTLLSMLEDRAPGVAQALDQDILHASNFDEILMRYRQQHYQGGHRTAPGYPEPLSDARIESLKSMIDALRQYCELYRQEEHTSGFVAIPEPELRVGPLV